MERRVLLAGWSSVVHGEATAGDVLSMRAVEAALRTAGVAVDLAWSPVMATAPGAGGVELAAADPADYTDLVWACGPLTGRAVAEVAERFAAANPACRRTAVGVSVIDEAGAAAKGWDLVLPRDAPGRPAVRDLAAGPAAALAAHVLRQERRVRHVRHVRHVPQGDDDGGAPLPVLGVYLAPGQAEYGARRRHGEVERVLGEWLGGLGAASLALDTRLDPRGWREAATAAQVVAQLGRCDAVVSMRLHGLVLALAAGVPVVAVDPVAGGGKVSAQAAAWGWPVVTAEEVLGQGGARACVLDEQLAWCLGPQGRAAAARAAREAPRAGAEQLAALVAAVLS